MPEIGESAIPSNIKFAPDKGGGGFLSKIKSIFSSEPQTPSNTPQEVRPTNEKPFDETFNVKYPNRYMLGRQIENPNPDAQRRIDIISSPNEDPFNGLSRRQLEFGIVPAKDGTTNFSLLLKNLGVNDILVFNRQEAGKTDPSLERLRRLPGKESRKQNRGKPEIIPDLDLQISDFANTALMIGLNNKEALRIEVAGSGESVGKEGKMNGEVSFKAWTVDKSEYDELLERALKEEEEF